MSNLPSKRIDLPENTPDKAPMPTFDPGDANYFDMFSPSYYNLETVQALTREGGGPLLLEVDHVAVEYVYNPEHGEDSGEWKPIVHFAGDGPSLVLNQTRAKVLMEATRSIHVKEWHKVGWLEVSAGIENGRAQIVIIPARLPGEPVPKEGHSPGPNGQQATVGELNEVLFG